MRCFKLYVAVFLTLVLWQSSCIEIPTIEISISNLDSTGSQSQPPIIYTDYEIKVLNSTLTALFGLVINGTNAGDVSFWNYSTMVHTSNPTLTITYSINVCDSSGCWAENDVCTLSLGTLEYGAYTIDIYNYGRGCKVNNLFNVSASNIYGSVVSSSNYADYGIKVKNSSDSSFIRFNNDGDMYYVTVNGANVGFLTVGATSQTLRSANTTASIAYSVYLTNSYGFWTSPKLCTLPLSSLPVRDYIIEIVDFGRGCRINASSYDPLVVATAGTVTDTSSDYTIKVYNSTVFKLANLTVNGTNLGKINVLTVSGGASTPVSTANLNFDLETCVSIYCTYVPKSCSVPLTGGFGTYFIHVSNNGDSCVSK